MYKNTKINKTGTSSGMAHKWNLFMALLLFILSCPLSSIAEDAKPFDCTMPVILKPLLEDIHGKSDFKNNKTPWQHVKCPHATYYFDVKTDKLKDNELKCDMIVEVSYECPSRHVFKLFVNDGLVMRMEHTEPSGEIHVYKQTIMDKLDKLHFDDEKYTQLSRECNLSICKGECLWLLLPDGKYQADFDVEVAISMMKVDFIGEMSLPRENLIYKFCFWDRFMKNGSMLYIGEERSAKRKIFPFHVITRTNGDTMEDCWIGSGSVHDKVTDTGFDAQFHKNMGIRFYTSNEKDNFGDAVIWDEKGKENKRLSSKKFEEVVIKSFTPVPKQ